MSPIKDRSIYPDSWPEIRERILERAGNRCECQGECGVTHPSITDPGPRCEKFHGKVHYKFPTGEGVRVVLTIAHLDHNAAGGNHADENLKAMCQGCHLRYDGWHRRA